MKIRVKMGAKKDGKLTAVYMDVKANVGPYGAHALTVPMNACSKSLPLFLCDNFGFDVTAYYSNASPTGAYQGYGAPKGSYAIQMAAAELSKELGMDPLDFLELNRVHEGSMLEILKCLGDGTFMLFSGGADLGTGLDTVCVKMASEILQTEMENVSILSGDTDNTPFDTGAYASSGTYFSGSAALLAAQDMKAKILEAASQILDEPLEDLSIQYPGKVVGKKDELDYAKLAWRTQAGEAQGQIFGGVLKSIGHTLYEGLVYDSDGRALNTDLRSYGVPMIGDVPEDFQVKLIYTDDPYCPFGAKSISEIATNGAAPVIANAIHDAIGVWMRKWPFTPEAVLRELGKIG